MLHNPLTGTAAQAAHHMPCNIRCTHLLSSNSSSSSTGRLRRSSTAWMRCGKPPSHYPSYSGNRSMSGPNQQPSLSRAVHHKHDPGHEWEQQHVLAEQWQQQQQQQQQKQQQAVTQDHQPEVSVSSVVGPTAVAAAAAAAAAAAQEAPAVTLAGQQVAIDIDISSTSSSSKTSSSTGSLTAETADSSRITSSSDASISSTTGSTSSTAAVPGSTRHCNFSPTAWQFAEAAHTAAYNSNIVAQRLRHSAAETREHLNNMREKNAQQIFRKAASFIDALGDSARETARELGPPATAAGTRLLGKKNAAAAVRLLGKSNTATAVGTIGASNTAAATEQLGVSGTGKVTEKLGPVGVMKVLKKLGPEGLGKVSVKLAPAIAQGVKRGAADAAAAVDEFLRAGSEAKVEMLKSGCGSCVRLLGSCGMLVLASAARVLLVIFAAAASWVSGVASPSSTAKHDRTTRGHTHGRG